MRIIYISDLDLTGSGYSHITINLCQGLMALGHDVKVIGLSYKNEQHPWNFSILSVNGLEEIIATANNLITLWKPHVVVVALDIPQQGAVLDRLAHFQLPYVAITPLESGPLCMQWTMSLMRATKLFLISQLGTEEVIKKGVQAEHLSIGIDTDSWKKRTKKEYREARKRVFGIEDDTFIILTVADNQERKNLAGAMDIVSMLKKKMGEDFQFRYALVTRPGSPVGWKLIDMAIRFGISEEYVEFERGLSFSRLWLLYACADAFLLTSKGEGLGMPVLEAMSVGVPVVGSAVGAIIEHLEDNRGYLIPHEYEMIDPYGNADRRYINRELAAGALELIAKGEGSPKAETRVKKAGAYVGARTWNIPVAQLDEAIRSIADDKEETQAEEIQAAAAI